MPQETLDPMYAALNDARAKRDAWDAVVASLEYALGIAGGNSGAALGATGGASGPPVDLPLGALMGKSVSNAIKIYMAASKRKQTTKEIAAALKEGGVESTSQNFDVIVNNTLRNLKSAGVVLQFKEGWALAELYPESLRSRLAQQESNGKATNKKKKARRAKRQKAGKTEQNAAKNETNIQELPKAS